MSFYAFNPKLRLRALLRVGHGARKDTTPGAFSKMACAAETVWERERACLPLDAVIYGHVSIPFLQRADQPAGDVS